ncbi:hypothetical protein DESC_660004 [Desulfosarcina cetonica]|nr:hypothetical protein DESC_660004 [Desulfosarcina cetonica]
MPFATHRFIQSSMMLRGVSISKEARLAIINEVSSGVFGIIFDSKRILSQGSSPRIRVCTVIPWPPTVPMLLNPT